jgi:exosortase A
MKIPSLPVGALQRLLPGVLLLAGLLLLFRDTAQAMVEIWSRSETFTHAFLVPPIVLWLIWRRQEALQRLPARPALWVLIPAAVLGFVWLLGALIGVNAGTQFALVALLVLSVPAVFGWAVARELTFPLLFLFFAVPLGEFMVPMMMEWTADFTIAALRMTGIPVYREGLNFVIPTGSWSVVEACSGVRYLIASFMVGTLFAYLNYQSTKRRVAFIVLSLLVPILANWFRAYLIVMLGHLSGNELAAGADHLIYGWVFFGIVIGIMFVVGARWSEPDAPLPAVPHGAQAVGAPAGQVWLAAGLFAAVAAAAPLAAAYLNARDAAAPEPQLALPASMPGGWQGGAPATNWEPAFAGARQVTNTGYVRGADQVDLWLGYYRGQGYDRKLVSSVNLMVEPTTESRWMLVARGVNTLTLAGRTVPLRVGDVRERASGGAGQRLRVWQVYAIQGELVSSDVRARLQLALNRLRGRGDDGAVIFISTPVPDISPEARAAADARLQAYVDASLPALLQAMEATRLQGAAR